MEIIHYKNYSYTKNYSIKYSFLELDNYSFKEIIHFFEKLVIAQAYYGLTFEERIFFSPSSWWILIFLSSAEWQWRGEIWARWTSSIFSSRCLFIRIIIISLVKRHLTVLFLSSQTQLFHFLLGLRFEAITWATAQHGIYVFREIPANEMVSSEYKQVACPESSSLIHHMLKVSLGI